MLSQKKKIGIVLKLSGFTSLLLILLGLFALFMRRGGSDYMFNDLSGLNRMLL